MAPGTSFGLQHDVRIHSAGDRLITLFDDSLGPPRVNYNSRGLTLALDYEPMTAKLALEQRHASLPAADFEGNQQRLPGGGAFLGCSQQPYFAEFDSRARLVLEGRFVPATARYRAYLLPWNGTPSSRPAVSASTRGGATTGYASWNGATDVTSWRVFGREPGCSQPRRQRQEAGLRDASVGRERSRARNIRRGASPLSTRARAPSRPSRTSHMTGGWRPARARRLSRTRPPRSDRCSALPRLGRCRRRGPRPHEPQERAADLHLNAIGHFNHAGAGLLMDQLTRLACVEGGRGVDTQGDHGPTWPPDSEP